jgi:alkanesulfonate monooxygenase SsuD/methylene tetrahydromethanopterin reductase-like flavin-dependent oxidoreductase (luciferase family)
LNHQEESFMPRKLGIALNWQEEFNLKDLIERAKIADAAGIHSIWIAETWGHDTFTMMTALAEHTSRIQLATAIVNIYSRTPAALAQHFGTLDKLSNGRMIMGLGTSSPQVVEHFHGVKFNPPLTRLKETVDIINMLLAGTPLNYDGKVFKLGRGFKLRFEAERKHIPIWIAALNPKSVEFTARHTDGWLPSMIPLGGLARATAEFRAIAIAAGRGPNDVEVKSPGHVTITNTPERARASHAGTVAFYAARMGTFYSEQLARYGFGHDVAKIKEAWSAGGSKAGIEAASPKLLTELGYIGGIDGALDRLNAQDEAGIDVHQVEIDATSPAEFEKIVARLL